MENYPLLILLLSVLIAGCGQKANLDDDSPKPPASVSQESNMMEHTWPFDSPEHLAVISLDRIMDGTNPILYVFHDEDDGSWQFLDGREATEENAMVVSLRNIADHDPTIRQLADLPLGWYASRDAVGKPWRRHPTTH